MLGLVAVKASEKCEFIAVKEVIQERAINHPNRSPQSGAQEHAGGHALAPQD